MFCSNNTIRIPHISLTTHSTLVSPCFYPSPSSPLFSPLSGLITTPTPTSLTPPVLPFSTLTDYYQYLPLETSNRLYVFNNTKIALFFTKLQACLSCLCVCLSVCSILGTVLLFIPLLCHLRLDASDVPLPPINLSLSCSETHTHSHTHTLAGSPLP